ncbi:hypothetical protein NDU88_011407 [Pleurodeles waltl]|uniref:Uncharacterized protein n=1 Tax=Pleurodeles waltl TaxID=8319 RepID=A0AAV7PYS1_PLEWA|nr:hypothetical protein NDU88_011407 [Pleurodeles waltl]
MARLPAPPCSRRPRSEPHAARSGASSLLLSFSISLPGRPRRGAPPTPDVTAEHRVAMETPSGPHRIWTGTGGPEWGPRQRAPAKGAGEVTSTGEGQSERGDEEESGKENKEERRDTEERERKENKEAREQGGKRRKGKQEGKENKEEIGDKEEREGK